MADRRVGSGECVSHRIARGNEGAETKEKTSLIPTALSAWYFNFNLLPKGDESPRYHRLHAVWYFNFNLLPKGDESPDTAGFMPCGTSISTYSQKGMSPP